MLIVRSSWLFLTLAVLLAGCTHPYRVRLEMPPQNRAVVRVNGDSFVTVTNDGPGDVGVSIADEEVVGKQQRRLGRFSHGTTVSGPTRVTLQTGPDEHASVEIEARGATGLTIESSPVPYGRVTD